MSSYSHISCQWNSSLAASTHLTLQCCNIAQEHSKKSLDVSQVDLLGSGYSNSPYKGVRSSIESVGMFSKGMFDLFLLLKHWSVFLYGHTKTHISEKRPAVCNILSQKYTRFNILILLHSSTHRVQGRTLLGVFPQKIAWTPTPAKDSNVMASQICLVHTLSLDVFSYAFKTVQLLRFVQK